MLDDIPGELLNAIVFYVDRPTLHALSLTNRTLRYPAQKQLFSSMTNAEDLDVQTKFLSTVIQNLRLAGYVKEFHFYAMADTTPAEADWRELTAEGLIAMNNLKTLVFEERSSRPPCAGFMDKDHGVTFSLEKLHWQSWSDERNLQKVLEQQRHSIRDLRLECTSGTILAPTRFPRLERLSGDLRVFKSFLHGSRVTHLTWNAASFNSPSRKENIIPDEDIRAGLKSIKRELGLVKTFCLRGSYYRPGLAAFSGLLDHMEVFELTGLTSVQELHLLKKFPSLRELILSPEGSVKITSPPLSRSRQNSSAPLFDSCPNLELVDSPRGWYGEPRVFMYKRWKRGVRDPLELPIQEVMQGRIW